MMCMGCPKAYHPGKNCDGTQRLCYFCKEPGHIATYCPKKKAAATTPPAAPCVAKPKGRIFMMSRAQAEASSHLFVGMFRVFLARYLFFLCRFHPSSYDLILTLLVTWIR